MFQRSLSSINSFLEMRTKTNESKKDKNLEVMIVFYFTLVLAALYALGMLAVKIIENA